MNKILRSFLLVTIASLSIVASAQAQLIINEINADPAGDLTGDANGDGTRDASDDEFIELVNTGVTDLDISGYKIYDSYTAITERHVFPDGTVVPAGGAIVVFGGGTPTGIFGGSIIQVASTGALGITNTQETMYVEDASGTTVDSYTHADEANSDQSITRDPDITGTTMVAHASATGADGSLFSPGTKVDGSYFIDADYPLIINEILADPAGDLTGDANGDGTRDASDDEFIELVNTGTAALDISGFSIYDTYSAVTERHVFPDETVVPAGGAIVVFGGGTPTGSFGGSVVQVASTGALGITNTEETMYVQDASANMVASYTHGSEANDDQSITRDPDITGTTLVAHTSATGADGRLFSPGTMVDGTYFIDVPTTTQIQFSASGSSVSEGDGTVDITISITSPSSTTATMVDVVLTSGDASQIGDYTTKTLTFAAGSSDAQTITVTLIDDTDIESTETYVFELQNISGGDDAAAADPSTYTLTLEDNDLATSSLIINEFLAWPAGSTADEDPVDANGDGSADYQEDEFIEFVNASSGELDISGWTVYDEYSSTVLRHTFPDGTVLTAGGALVLFGGGNPTGEFGGSIVQIANGDSQQLGLTNSNDVILVKNLADEKVIELSYGSQTRGTSTTLNPDITGAIGPHPDLNGLNISPGTKVDGTSFAIATSTTVQFALSSGSVSETAGSFEVTLSITRASETVATTADVVIISTDYADDMSYTTQTVTFPAGSSDAQTVTIQVTDDDLLEGDELFEFEIQNVSGGTSATVGSTATFEFTINDDDVPLIFNEVYADPASGTAGDANNDGVVSDEGYEDEFIEIVNQSEEDIDLGGATFYTDGNLQHTFPVGTVLEPGRALVVFGGGIPTGLFGGSEVQLATEGALLLPDDGAYINILSTGGDLMAAMTYGASAGNDVSITRSPDITGSLVTHTSVEDADGAYFSPGTKANGDLFINVVTEVESEAVEVSVDVFPNPTAANVTVQLSWDPPASFVLYDLAAKKVVTQPLTETKTTVSLQTLRPGVYIYTITGNDAGKVKRGKLIIN